jgi:hypothetical protein
LNSTPTISTERVASVSINHERLLSAPYRFRDMTQGHLATRFRIHNVFTTIQSYPSTEAWDLALYSGHLQPHATTLPPTPLCILNSEFHSSFLSHFVFLRNVCRLLVTANVPSSPILLTLRMEALSSSETSVLARAT